MSGSFPKLGEILVRWKSIGEDDLRRALELQELERKAGQFRLLGEILMQLQVSTAEQIRMALERQGRTIMRCAECLAHYNVELPREGQEYHCPKCQHSLSIPTQLENARIEDWVQQSQPLAEPRYPRARFGPYEILGEISRGGMGIIYKAKDVKLDRLLAIKVMLAGSKSGEVEAERFLIEARAVSRLRHPNIIAIHSIGAVDGIDFFSMDFIEGRTLDRVQQIEKTPVATVCEIFAKISDAIAYAHSKGVLHRDVKPHNILLDHDLSPMVIDFGIAKLKDKPSDTGKNEILGSPAYLAPEYILGSVPTFTEGCDVYGIGACLYFMLVGRPPHIDPDEIELLRKVALTDPEPIRRIDRRVDRRLAKIVGASVARDPALRYQSAAELAMDLRLYLNGDEPLLRSGPLARAWRRWRKPVAAAFGGVVSIALVFLSGIYTRQQIAAEEKALEQGVSAGELARSYLELSSGFQTLREASRAGKFARMALKHAQAGGDVGLMAQAHELLARAYDLEGRKVQASEERVKAERLREGLDLP